MHCPFCGASETKVVDSRLVTEVNQVRRRRECLQCVTRFTTYETPELAIPHIVKRDGKRVSFNPAKLRSGMLRALEKRPVSAEEVDAVENRIIQKLRASGEKEIASRMLGEWIMDELKELDHVAYVRFASVYRSFEDVNAFRETIDKLQDEPIAGE